MFSNLEASQAIAGEIVDLAFEFDEPMGAVLDGIALAFAAMMVESLVVYSEETGVEITEEHVEQVVTVYSNKTLTAALAMRANNV